MTTTVTIDKRYFETLLRRAEFRSSGKDLTTPFDLPTVTILKCDHDNLLNLAQEYAALRDALFRGGIAQETLEVLIRGEISTDGPIQPLNNDEAHVDGSNTYAPVYQQPINSPHPHHLKENPPPAHKAQPRADYFREHSGNSNRLSTFTPDENAFISDAEKDDGHSPAVNRHHHPYARNEQRTILIKCLSDKVVHKDIADIVRGGALLDIYVRAAERIASVSFVEGSAAQNFLNYTKRNDIYIHSKRAEFMWNDRQFTLPGHVASKIQAGATRNLLIRNIHPNITEGRIREDLDHIHNLVVIDVTFLNTDAYISLNSVHNSLYARTCMMSRGAYKSMKIEWFPDECAQPLPKTMPTPHKQTPQPTTKKNNPMANRFEMLNIDGTEDGSLSDNDDKDQLTGFTSFNRGGSWAASQTLAV